MKQSTLLAALAIGGVLIFCGCDSEPAATPGAASSAPPAAAAPSQPPAPVVKPVYTLEIKTSETNPKTHQVIWTAQVNTGGWAMKTESVLVEDMMGKLTARVYAFLEQPAPGDMTTQAVETLRGEYDAGERAVEAAELSIKQVTRGDTSAIAGYYVIVKRAGM